MDTGIWKDGKTERWKDGKIKDKEYVYTIHARNLVDR